MIEQITLIIPFYRNVGMLREQMRVLADYPDGWKFIVVDDGSPEPAADIVASVAQSVKDRLALYRITVDLPWNRGGARNLGAKQADTKWLLHVDIDHVLPPTCAGELLKFEPNPKRWYRFRRYRKGKADETRMKDKVPRDAEYVEIHPHIDSYLVAKDLFWKTGGYDEDYTGCLGGGSPFLRSLEAIAKVDLAPPKAFLEVYTRSTVADASDHSLSRDRTEYARRRKRKEATGKTRPTNPIRFPWERVL